MTYKEVPENNVYYLTFVTGLVAAARHSGGVQCDAAAVVGLHGDP